MHAANLLLNKKCWPFNTASNFEDYEKSDDIKLFGNKNGDISHFLMRKYLAFIDLANDMQHM